MLRASRMAEPGERAAKRCIDAVVRAQSEDGNRCTAAVQARKATDSRGRRAPHRRSRKPSLSGLRSISSRAHVCDDGEVLHTGRPTWKRPCGRASALGCGPGTRSASPDDGNRCRPAVRRLSTALRLFGTVCFCHSRSEESNGSPLQPAIANPLGCAKCEGQPRVGVNVGTFLN